MCLFDAKVALIFQNELIRCKLSGNEHTNDINDPVESWEPPPSPIVLRFQSSSSPLASPIEQWSSSGGISVPKSSDINPYQ